MAKWCPECPHCQAKVAGAATTEDGRVTVRSVRSQLRPWEYGYGQKITGIVDWYDGWWIGSLAETDNAEVPPLIIDKRQWVSGFIEGWKDAEATRRWRKERAGAAA